MAEDLPNYLNDVMRSPLLSPEEETRLLRAAKEGDESARQKVVAANMRLVVNIAKTFPGSPLPLQDLVQDGTIGLMQSIDRFDPENGFRLSTYATHWIRAAVKRAVERQQKS